MVRTVNGNSVSSLTWNGTALSPVADSLIDTAYGHRIQWFHLENPDSGTHNIALTLGSSDSPVFFIDSDAGVAQSGQPPTATTVQVVTQTQNQTASLPMNSSDDWALMGAWTEYTAPISGI